VSGEGNLVSCEDVAKRPRWLIFQPDGFAQPFTAFYTSSLSSICHAAFSGKSGANPALSRNCKNLIGSSQNARSCIDATPCADRVVGKNIRPTPPLFPRQGLFHFPIHHHKGDSIR
jgi:hypothetical protein